MIDEKAVMDEALKIAATHMHTKSPGGARKIVDLVRKFATPPPGHIIDESGTVRKVLGTLPITGCGSVLGWGVFNMWRIVGNRREVVGPFHEEMGPNGWASQHGLPDKFYSTEQAAREAGGTNAP